MADTVKALLSVCLAFVGVLITITLFFIYALLFRMKRQSVYHVSYYDNTPRPDRTEDQTRSFETARHAETTAVDQATADDGKDTDSLTRNLSFSKFDRQEQLDKTRHGEMIGDFDIKKDTTETLNHSENVEPVQMADDTSDSVDKESLTRGLTFTNFENLIEYAGTIQHSEISVSAVTQEQAESPGNTDTEDYETLTVEQSEHADSTRDLETSKRPWKTKGNLDIQLHPETVEQLQTTITDSDDATDDGSQIRGLSFSNFDKLIDKYASTVDQSRLPEHPIIQEHPEIQPNPDTADLPMEVPVGNYREQSETSEYSEIHVKGEKVGNTFVVHTSDETEHIYSLPFKGRSHQQVGFVTDSADVTRSQQMSEKLSYHQNEANSGHSTDSDETAEGLSWVKINNNYLEPAAQPDSASHQTISKEEKVKRFSASYDTSDTADSLGIMSFGSHQQRAEKQVTFSGNDSTYIVETKGKTVQLLEFDETSNFEFVKIVKQQQKNTH